MLFPGPVYQQPRGKKAAGGRNGRHNASKKLMAAWRKEAQPQLPPEVRDSRLPVHMHIDAYFKRPQAHYNRRGVLAADAPHFYTNTPDSDNITKFVGDSLKGVAFRDDRTVYHAGCAKHWTEGETRTAVTLTYIEK